MTPSHDDPSRRGSTNKQRRVRVFCAIELPDFLREAIADHILQLRSRVPDVRVSWERNDKLHLTVKFFGEIESERVELVTSAASTAAGSTRSFDLELKDAGVFPQRGSPRILWIGITDLSGRLAQLYERLESESHSAGFAREPRAFHPHITVARIRTPGGARKLAEVHEQIGFAPLEFGVSELLVMRSELMSAGSRYSEISRHTLVE